MLIFAMPGFDHVIEEFRLSGKKQSRQTAGLFFTFYLISLIVNG